jgi:predicted enzyme related to lactoylglutathione lyase
VEAPFGDLTYVYVGSADTKRDVEFHTSVFGAKLVWEFHGFGAHVAALRLGPGPLVLLADHRPAKATMLIYRVEDLQKTTKLLKKRGWSEKSETVEVPDGPVLIVHDPTGNEIGLLQQDRPNALLAEYQKEQPETAERQRRSK